MRTVMLLAALLGGCAARPAPSTVPVASSHTPTGAHVDARTFTNAQLRADLDQLWTFARDHYCFFDEKRVDWERVRDRYRARLDGMTDGLAFVPVAAAMLDELYDLHTHLQMHLDGMPRIPGHDLWASWRDGRAIVDEVRRPSDAWRAGVRAGDEVLAIDGVPVTDAMRARRSTALTGDDPEADAWALRAVLSGTHGAPRTLRLRDREVVIAEGPREPEGDVVTSRVLDGNVGYIAIRSFADRSLVERFDHELEGLRETRALVIDVRNNGGGNTAWARPVMGRFVTARTAYARMTRRDGDAMSPPWEEFLEARGPFTYTRPVVVLVNHWSASMAEGFPMGLRGIGRARIVGTRMMGLGAAVHEVMLGWTQVPAQVSAEPVYRVDGTARWRMEPDVSVDLTRATADDEDPILAAGLRALADAR